MSFLPIYSSWLQLGHLIHTLQAVSPSCHNSLEYRTQICHKLPGSCEFLPLLVLTSWPSQAASSLFNSLRPAPWTIPGLPQRAAPTPTLRRGPGSQRHFCFFQACPVIKLYLAYTLVETKAACMVKRYKIQKVSGVVPPLCQGCGAWQGQALCDLIAWVPNWDCAVEASANGFKATMKHAIPSHLWAEGWQ